MLEQVQTTEATQPVTSATTQSTQETTKPILSSTQQPTTLPPKLLGERRGHRPCTTHNLPHNGRNSDTW
jgi:hypothetical protein